MKTDLLVFAGTVLLLAAVPMVLHAEEGDDWATRSPLALGEPMADCDIHHHATAAVALESAPALPADKVEAILATPDVVPAVAAPVIMPPAPVKTPSDKTTQLSPPRHLSPAALLTFALIASPGTALPQTAGGARD